MVGCISPCRTLISSLCESESESESKSEDKSRGESESYHNPSFKYCEFLPGQQLIIRWSVLVLSRRKRNLELCNKTWKILSIRTIWFSHQYTLEEAVRIKPAFCSAPHWNPHIMPKPRLHGGMENLTQSWNCGESENKSTLLLEAVSTRKGTGNLGKRIQSSRVSKHCSISADRTPFSSTLSSAHSDTHL